MKKLILFSFFVSIIFIGCKDECDCEPCGFHQPGHTVEPQSPMLCADSCYFSFELFGKLYSYSSTELGSSESVKCLENDSCSHVMENIWVNESFKFAIQRFEDSLQFIQSFNKRLPLCLYDCLLWGQKTSSASFELMDQCSNNHYITTDIFPEKNYVIYDSAVLIEENINSLYRAYYYTIKGSFSAEISIEQYTNTINGVYDVNGQFSVFTKLVIFNK